MNCQEENQFTSRPSNPLIMPHFYIFRSSGLPGKPALWAPCGVTTTFIFRSAPQNSDWLLALFGLTVFQPGHTPSFYPKYGIENSKLFEIWNPCAQTIK